MFFLRQNVFTSDDGSQNMFIYLSTLVMLEKGKVKDTDYVVRRKSKGVYTSKLEPLYTAFLYSIDRKNFSFIYNKTVSYFHCIVYDLDAWIRNPTRNFKFKSCLYVVYNQYSKKQ